MLVETISSRQNPLVKRLIAVREGRERRFLFLEGIRLILDALRSGIRLEVVAYSPRLLDSDRGRELVEKLKREPCRGAILTDQLMNAVSDLETPPGVVALGARPFYEIADFADAPNPLFVIADGMQDPGNLGALIRTAEAVGATGFISARGSADPFQMKALRAAAGTALRLPVVTGIPAATVISELRGRNVRIVAADAGSPVRYTDFDWKTPCALWLGSEAVGLAGRDGVADAVVSIPMVGDVESLNIAVAASLLLFEAARQRGTF
jgi:TrmH family RNA methyltransferase